MSDPTNPAPVDGPTTGAPDESVGAPANRAPAKTAAAETPTKETPCTESAAKESVPSEAATKKTIPAEAATTETAPTAAAAKKSDLEATPAERKTEAVAPMNLAEQPPRPAEPTPTQLPTPTPMPKQSPTGTADSTPGTPASDPAKQPVAQNAAVPGATGQKSDAAGPQATAPKADTEAPKAAPSGAPSVTSTEPTPTATGTPSSSPNTLNPLGTSRTPGTQPGNGPKAAGGPGKPVGTSDVPPANRPGAKKAAPRRRPWLTVGAVAAVLVVLVALGYYAGLGPMSRLSTTRAINVPATLGGLDRITDSKTRNQLGLDAKSEQLSRINDGKKATVEAYSDPAGSRILVVVAMRGKVDINQTVKDSGATPQQIKKVGQSTCLTSGKNNLTQCYRGSNTLTVIAQDASEKMDVNAVGPITDEAFNAMK
jgi:hypothetical protein